MNLVGAIVSRYVVVRQDPAIRRNTDTRSVCNEHKSRAYFIDDRMEFFLSFQDTV
ncbi:uncharacterized protein METZ01_LOCUS296481 [marine metagenome]|uniref:Uncharacterized protein n=1 Tax=marine metagenome TaxID=408172 RepID=A0A382M7F2_9ZZZZ